MSRLASFLPVHLRRRLLGRASLPELPSEDRFVAALLYADISGFTALTEKLQARGRDGAEEIVALVGAVLGPAVDRIHAWGGSVVNFAGDGLFAVFPGSRAVACAVSAAREIRRSFETVGPLRSSAGPVRLTLSQCIHAGAVSQLHLGRPGHRMGLVAGPACRALARFDTRVRAGAIGVTPGARARMGNGAAVALPIVAPGWRRDVEAYVPVHVRQLAAGFAGEFRTAAMLFFETEGGGLSTTQSFARALQESVERYEGICVGTDISTVGIRWLTAFGAPVGHEDDAERAARCALEVLARTPPRMRARAGLNVGVVASVLVGTRTRRSFELMGDVTNTAARVLASARFGELLVPESARRQMPGSVTEPRGHRRVKGKARALALHAVRAPSGARALQVSSPLHGRATEMEILRGALSDARDGRGGVVGITGDAGIGKSRLKWELGKGAVDAGFQVVEGRASALGSSPRGPLSEILQASLGVAPGDGSAIRAALSAAGSSDADRERLLMLAGIEESAGEGSDVRAARGNVLAALVTHVRATARRQPLMVVVEDVHAADEMTRDFVELCARAAADERLLVLLLYRGGYDPPASARVLRLEELPAEAIDQMVVSLLGEASASAIIRERAGGNPFYVEEVARHLIECGVLEERSRGYALARPPVADELPGSLESLIQARLDALGADARRVAHVASVQGRRFSEDLLFVTPGIARIFSPAIDELERRQIVFEEPGGGGRYIFKHALTRDVAYGAMLGSHRRAVHAALARRMERFPAEARRALAPLLAHHHDRAGHAAKARPAYLAAAREARDRYALDEAEAMFRAYLGLTRAIPRRSIQTCARIASQVLAPRGEYTLAREVLERCLAAATRARDRVAEMTSLSGMAVLAQDGGQLREAGETYRRVADLARVLGRSKDEAGVANNLGRVLQMSGRFDEARDKYREAIDRAGQLGDRRGLGQAMGNLALLEFEQGRVQEAADLWSRSLAIHAALGNTLDEAIDVANLAMIEGRRGAETEAESLNRRALALFERLGHRQYQAYVAMNMGLVRQNKGWLDEASALYQRALSLIVQIGDRRGEGHVLGLLANLECLAGGDLEKARSWARSAEEILAACGDRVSVCHALCALGHIELALGNDASPVLDRVTTIERALPLGSEADLASSVARLSRAVAARGQGLVCGFAAEDIAPEVLAWLRGHRPEALAASRCASRDVRSSADA